MVQVIRFTCPPNKPCSSPKKVYLPQNKPYDWSLTTGTIYEHRGRPLISQLMRTRRSARRRDKPLAGGVFGDEEVGDDAVCEQAARLGHTEAVTNLFKQAALDETHSYRLGGRRKPGRRDALTQAQT